MSKIQYLQRKQDAVENICVLQQCLLDLGGSHSLIARSRIPRGAIVNPMTQGYNAMSAGGVCSTPSTVISPFQI